VGVILLDMERVMRQFLMGTRSSWGSCPSPRSSSSGSSGSPARRAGRALRHSLGRPYLGCRGPSAGGRVGLVTSLRTPLFLLVLSVTLFT